MSSPTRWAGVPLIDRRAERRAQLIDAAFRLFGDGGEAAVTASDDSLRDRTRAGIAAVLGFSSADPRRGRILFTDARANPVLAARRTATQDLLREGVLTEGWRLKPGSDPVAAQVGAALYTGAMAELAQQWLAGNLGTDLGAVVDYAVQTVLR